MDFIFYLFQYTLGLLFLSKARLILAENEDFKAKSLKGPHKRSSSSSKSANDNQGDNPRIEGDGRYAKFLFDVLNYDKKPFDIMTGSNLYHSRTKRRALEVLNRTKRYGYGIPYYRRGRRRHHSSSSSSSSKNKYHRKCSHYSKGRGKCRRDRRRWRNDNVNLWGGLGRYNNLFGKKK